MNLDSVVTIQLGYASDTTVAEIVDSWDDGEIAELLEGVPEAVEEFEEEVQDWILETTEAVLKSILVDGKPAK